MSDIKYQERGIQYDKKSVKNINWSEDDKSEDGCQTSFDASQMTGCRTSFDEDPHKAYFFKGILYCPIKKKHNNIMKF